MNKAFFLPIIMLSLTCGNIISGTPEHTAKRFRELLCTRIHARLQHDSTAYNATQAEFDAKSAEARFAAKELYAQCPYVILGFFTSNAKKRSACGLLAQIATNPDYYSDLETGLYMQVKRDATRSDGKNSEIIDQKLKEYKRRARRNLPLSTKNGLKRELDPGALAKDVQRN